MKAKTPSYHHRWGVDKIFTGLDSFRRLLV